MRRARLASALLLTGLIFSWGCSDDDSGAPPPATATRPPTAVPPSTATAVPIATATATPTHAPQVIVFSGEGNRLNAYASASGFPKQNVIANHNSNPNGRDVNGQICFLPDGSRRFIAGEDTGQPNPPQGWGLFQLSGDEIGSLSATQIGKLTPTYQGSSDNAENYGCGFLSDGRLVTSDVGNQAAGPGDGQLIVWFQPFDAEHPRYCKLATNIATAGGIWVDDQDRVYVASARAPAVLRFSPPFPTSDDEAGGCGKLDATNAPLATQVTRETFIPADGVNLVTPSAIVQGHGDHFFVSSVLNGVIAEYDVDGHFLRRVLSPPSGETLPYSTGSPFGLGIDPEGTLYFADIGLVVGSGGIGPGDNTGHVRRLRFVAGAPQPPEIMDSNLDFPDGIGILAE